MSYPHFDPARPDAVTENITQFAAGIRENLAALRDIVLLGVAPGWSYSTLDGTPEEPAYLFWAKGGEFIRAACTWGDTGGEAGNLTEAVYAYSDDGGLSWHPMGTYTITYNASGDVTSAVWS